MLDPDTVLEGHGEGKVPMAQATLLSDGTTHEPSGGSHVFLPSEQPSSLIDQQVQALRALGFPPGVARAMNQNNASFPLRIWVVDNSGSMNIGDGSRLMQTNIDVKVVHCTRWAEIQQTVIFHSEMAALLEAPTVFRLLNDPGAAAGNQQFGIVESDKKNIAQELEIAKSTITKAVSAGVTPLSARLLEIRENILQLAPRLRKDGTRVAIILATDGLPTNPSGTCSEITRDQFVEALRSLEGLPVWVVVRLCTDERDVVEFYNDLDHQLEISLEVLDDFFGEAKELYKYNKWINYAMPLHRCREMGYHHRLFDLMDERKLTKDEVREYFDFLFGEEKTQSMPNIHSDWKGFLASAQRLVDAESKQFNPIRKKLAPWIDVKKLSKAYRSGKGCTLM